MALMDFVKKQFIDILEWTETGDGTLAWRFPAADREIQHGASLTVRESQAAVFVDEGRIADLFGPGRYRLTTRTLPVLTYLRHWDKLFESPFKSDVYFFSTRQHLDRRWGTSQPVTIRDREFGAVRLRAFGNYTFHVADPKRFHTAVSGTRERFTLGDLDDQLRALMVQHLSDAIAASGIAFVDLAASQVEFARRLAAAVAGDFSALGLALDSVTVQNLSLPEELQKVLDQRIGMGMVGADMGRFLQYQTAQAIPRLAEGAAGGGGGGGGVIGDALGLGAGVALGQVMAAQLASGLPQGTATPPAPTAARQADEIIATIEKLAGLHARGILTEDEFATRKAGLLKRLG